jgi:DNA repair protein RadC
MRNKIHTIQEMELVYLPKRIIPEIPKTTNSFTSFKILQQLFNPNTIRCQEEFIVLYLNSNNRIIGSQQLSKGGIASTVVDIRLILGTALKSLASGIILSHNHPSGNRSPSENDKVITVKIQKACKLLDINLLDHIIITPDDGYFSFADDGLL